MSVWAYPARRHDGRWPGNLNPRKPVPRLLEIIINVGRTGRLAPQALLETVELDGVNITYATLNSVDYIADNDIRIGDMVTVARAGDVIPQITGSIKELRPADSKPYEFPKECPVCYAATELDGALVYCRNKSCRAQLESWCKFAYGRPVMNVMHLGPASVATLVEGGYIHESPADLFTLSMQDLTKSGINASDRAYYSINTARKEIELGTIIQSLGIRKVGSTFGEIIADSINDLSDLPNLSVADLLAAGVKPVAAGNVVEWAAKNRHIIDSYIRAGLTG